MRKLNYVFIALLTMLLAASCSQDDTLSAERGGNEAMVSLALELPAGLQTRAISDGLSVDQLIYAVYYKGAVLKGLEGAETPGTNEGQFVVDAFNGTKAHTINLSLLKGKEYTIAFWAQTKGTDFYNTDDLAAVAVNYSGENNSETRDAFFGTHTFTVATDVTIEATLKRPFAQLNVGVTQSDFDNATAAGLLVAQSSVVIENAASQINLLTGATVGTETITYSLASIPSDPATLTTEIAGTSTDFKYLSMSYFLVNDGGSTDGTMKANLTSLKYVFENADNSESVSLSEGLKEVPVRRNYRTNIVGKLLTSDIQFNVTIDEIFDGNITENDDNALLPVGTYLVKNNDELTAALAKSDVKVIVLANNIALPAALVINKEITIDGQNFSFDKTVDITANNVTIKNLIGTPGLSSLGGTATKAFVVGNGNNGVVFDNVTITTSGGRAITGLEGAEFEVKNSTIENQYVAISPNPSYSKTKNRVDASNNTFKNCTFGIRDTEYTVLSITNNTFIALKVGGEGVSLHSHSSVNMTLIFDSNNFDNIGTGISAVVDYRSGTGVKYDKDGNII